MRKTKMDEFLDSLEEEDRKLILEWVNDGKSLTALYRVVNQSGFQIGRTTVREWAERLHLDNTKETV